MSEETAPPAVPAHPDRFARRHLGPSEEEVDRMLAALNLASLDELVDQTVPADIRQRAPLRIPPGWTEAELLRQLRAIAAQNEMCRSYIGLGYADCITPAVIQRNVLENPGWYTQYTPYQSEIAQGRLEALLNFQTMVIELTGMEIANASLLDEGTAAAEAMAMVRALQKKGTGRRFFVSSACHPQTIAVVQTRARPRGLEVVVGDHREASLEGGFCGVLLQYPATDGAVHDYREICQRAHAAGVLVVVAADLLSLALLTPPGEFGADVVVGSTQRFGMPMGYGGPHAAYLATREEYRRQVPGRLVGVSRDAQGKMALRLALQTREQHIRREKATSNICTAQVLPAVVASMYAVYHGPEGLRSIARRIHGLACLLARGARRLGLGLVHEQFFDSVCLEVGAGRMSGILSRARQRRINLRTDGDSRLVICLDETCGEEDVADLLAVLAREGEAVSGLGELVAGEDLQWEPVHRRTSPYLQHPVFRTHHSETSMLRYLRRLESRDLSLTSSMIPLGSCTMKLNGTAQMLPITWPEFARLHPFAPVAQAQGYQRLFDELEQMLAEITGLARVSLQPNAGSQGEYAGLLVVRQYHESHGQGHRRVCLIPASAHGTNPASATMAGLQVVVVRCDSSGNVDLDDLRRRAEEHRESLAALMITYPSTHGVFEADIRRICQTIHEHGGQVYMDGANMNALVGLCRPGELGADVCHLNLHKTFAVPHGGGGPGMGPIAVAEHLAAFLPTHPVVPTGGPLGIGPVASAPWSSALVLLISWAYLRLMGGEGLTRATQVAILNANYLVKRLDAHFPILYRGQGGWVAHEAILDLRPAKAAGIEVEDVAKRLMDYGFHAPTVSFPVPGTLMVEPTESEDLGELDRFCEALIAIRQEIAQLEAGQADPDDNPLRNAPHTADMVLATDWSHPYTREQAALPAPWLRERKFWPAVARLDNALGDRQLVCACPPADSYA